jgi:hypothetical protein
MPFNIKLTTSFVDIENTTNKVKKGWVSFSINPESVMIYISRDINRIYWIGHRTGKSAKLTIKLNDKKK